MKNDGDNEGVGTLSLDARTVSRDGESQELISGQGENHVIRSPALLQESSCSHVLGGCQQCTPSALPYISTEPGD